MPLSTLTWALQMILNRHDLIWLTARGWDNVQADARAQPMAVRDAIARWRAADWPLVVRRAEPGMEVRMVALGMPLPPDTVTGIRPPVSCLAERCEVERQEPPLPLAAVLQSAPPQWRSGLLALHMESLESLERQPPLRVFGSLAWQTITGMTYLRGSSDIDLLFAPTTRREVDDGIEMLSRHGDVLPLDGEIVFPSGAAVAWKEWRDSARPDGMSPLEDARVLTKQHDQVALVSCSALLATLAG